MKTCKKFRILAAVYAMLLLIVGCSSEDNDSSDGVSSSLSSTTTSMMMNTTSDSLSVEEQLVVSFSARNGNGTVTLFGETPVTRWFSSLPGEVSLDLVDADVSDAVSVVEEVVGFWFFRDENSGDVPPSIFESSVGGITDSVGTRYVVAAELLGPAPGTETTTTTSETTTSTTAASTTSFVPDEETGTSETPSTTSTTSTTTSTTTTVVSPVVLQVQVLNGSGVAGAAGRMTDKLSEAGYAVLSPENAPQRYSSSAVYFAEGWQDEAEEVLETVDIDEIDGVTAMPQQFVSEEAAVVVLLGVDTAPAIVGEQAGLRPRQRNDVSLPLPASVPRDRFVPGLAAVNLYTEENESNPASAGQLVDLALFLGRVGYCHPYFGGQPQLCQEDISLAAAYQAIEDVLGQLGFTPQNVCGAPAGYSFTDLLKPTREWNETFRNYSGDAIFTTDRLIELHGGQRINPEANLDFYIREAVQTAHDSLRLAELSDEVEAPQMILCDTWKLPSGEIPEAASAYWYALLTPGIQPRESLLSQGTYHLKDMSKNGNLAYVVVCHPTLGEKNILLHWREAGYRAELVAGDTNNGCQAGYESQPYYSSEPDTFKFPFGEHVFSASDLLQFPRG